MIHFSGLTLLPVHLANMVMITGVKGIDIETKRLGLCMMLPINTDVKVDSSLSTQHEGTLHSTSRFLPI